MPGIGIAISPHFQQKKSLSSYWTTRKPTGLTTTVLSDTSVKLDWTDNCTEEDGFSVYISTDNVTFTPILTLAADSETYTATGLTAGTVYYFKVAAYKGNSEGVSVVERAIVPKYYVDATGGLDTNDGLTPDTAWQSITKVNAATLTAGMSVGFKSGETWTGQIATKSGSSMGNIYYCYYGTGAKPVITYASNKTVYVFNDAYISFIGLNIINTFANVNSGAIQTGGSDCTNLEVIDCALTSAGISLNLGSPITGLLIKRTTFSGGGNNAIYAYGANSSNVVIEDCTLTNHHGIIIRNFNNVTVKNLIVTGSASLYGLAVLDSTGVIDVQDINLVSCAGIGYYMSNCDFTSGLVTRFKILDAGAAGVSIADCNNFNISTGIIYSAGANCMTLSAACHHINVTGVYAYDGGSDGFVTVGTSHDITFKYCRASNCGNKSTTTNGDGFTCHESDYNIKFVYCIGNLNTAAGTAFVGTSAGMFYNCTLANNAGDWRPGGVLQNRAGLYIGVTALNPVNGEGWKVKNCIISTNFVTEHAVAYSYVTLNHNRYYAISEANFNSAGQSWDTYHATNEPDSEYGDPLLTNLIPATKIEIGENLGVEYEDGLDITTNWGDSTTLPVIVTRKQGVVWQAGAYVQ